MNHSCCSLLVIFLEIDTFGKLPWLSELVGDGRTVEKNNNKIQPSLRVGNELDELAN